MQRRSKRSRKIKRMKKFTPKMQAKLLLVFCVFTIALIGLIAKLVLVNRSDGDKYAKRVLSQQTYTSSVVPYKRGTIYDNKGTILAFSDKSYNLIFDVKSVLSGDDGEYIEPTISALLECYDFLSEEELYKTIEEKPDSQYVILKKELTYDEMIKFEDYKEEKNKKAENKDSKINGVWFDEAYLRRYPNDELASNIIGFTTADGKGNWGIEQYYNDELNGTNGISFGYIDNELNLKSKVHPPSNGNSLVTTIESNAQRIVQDYILGFNEEFGSKNIGVVLMNPQNGEIYAMASNEEYNLNNPTDLSPFLEEEAIASMTEEEKLDYLNGVWRNFTISDSFEPGSTFKPFTIAAGLEEGLIGENQTFVCDGGEEVGGWNIRCHRRSGHGTITLTEALSQSCNDALMQIAAIEGRNLFHKYQTFFGFGSKTGIDLPGEAEGLLTSVENLNSSELATSSFGQTFTVSMVQMAAGYSSLVNGGNYYKPHIVKQILNDDGAVIKEIEPEILKKTSSVKTSDFIQSSMYSAVEEGTAKKASVIGYKVAGKTGTAQKQPRSAGTYVVSFLGHVPADNPEVVIFVVIDEAENVPTQANSALATELASAILKDVLPFLEVYPTEEVIEEETSELGTEAVEEETQAEETEAETEATDTTEEETEAETEEDIFSPDAIPDSMNEEETDPPESE